MCLAAYFAKPGSLPAALANDVPRAISREGLLRNRWAADLTAARSK